MGALGWLASAAPSPAHCVAAQLGSMMGPEVLRPRPSSDLRDFCRRGTLGVQGQKERERLGPGAHCTP